MTSRTDSTGARSESDILCRSCSSAGLEDCGRGEKAAEDGAWSLARADIWRCMVLRKGAQCTRKEVAIHVDCYLVADENRNHTIFDCSGVMVPSDVLLSTCSYTLLTNRRGPDLGWLCRRSRILNVRSVSKWHFAAYSRSRRTAARVSDGSPQKGKTLRSQLRELNLRITIVEIAKKFERSACN